MRRRGFGIAVVVVLAVVFSATAGKPKAEKATMSGGERLYRANCASCHRLISPAKFSDDKWPLFVERYGTRLKLDSTKKQQILDYLLAANE